MQNLNLYAGIIAVVLLILSVHFNFIDRWMDKLGKATNKIENILLIILFGAIILFAIGWNIYRFLK